MAQDLRSLERLLEANGVARDASEVLDLVRGVAAAPPAHEPDRWLDLVAPADASELRDELRRLLADLRATPPAAPPVAERLAALRATLERRNAQGFVLPLTDEHGSEYLPEASRRLTWLTGFTGSAGFLVVLPERAALFTDGRYTLQADAELDAALYERRHMTDDPPEDWLRRHVQPGMTIGYDPALHRKAGVERLERALRRAGGEFVPLEPNPVDEVWTTRPAMPVAPIENLDEQFAGESAAEKRVRMGAAVAEAGADVAVLSAPDSIAWLLNIRGSDVPFNPLVLSFALLHADGAVDLFVDRRKLRPAQDLGNGVRILPIDGFADALAELGHAGRAVLADPAAVSVQVTRRLEDAGARLVEGREPCAAAKACKNPVELDGARRAQIRDGAAMVRFLAWLDARAPAGGLTEVDAAARLLDERARDPWFRGESFPAISGAGPNGAIVHYRVTPESSRPLEPGSLYLIDSGGQYLDATTDVTRTVAIGEPAPIMRRHFTLVLKGHIALTTAVFLTGTSGGQLDVLARQHLWQAGLDFDHGTGHGVGAYLCVHEGPARIGKRSADAALRPGMILSNEPGYYRSGAYGIRIENLIAVVTGDRPKDGERALLAFETLTRVPLDRRLIERDLLTGAERIWLDNYHARVRADLIDRVAGEARDWLLGATAPL